MKLIDLLNQKSNEQSKEIEGNTLIIQVNGHKAQVRVEKILDTDNDKFRDAIMELDHLSTLLHRSHGDYFIDDDSSKKEIRESIRAAKGKLLVIVGIIGGIYVNGDNVNINWWHTLSKMINILHAQERYQEIDYDKLEKDISHYIGSICDILNAEIVKTYTM